jgi:hypothetical protein
LVCRCAWGLVRKLRRLHASEPFLGIVTNQPGYHCFLVYLVATLPITILAGVGGWLVRAGRERSNGALIVTLWFIVPLAVSFRRVRMAFATCFLRARARVMAAAGWEYVATLA